MVQIDIFVKKIESNQHYFKETFDKQTLLSLDITSSEFEECEFYGCDFVSSIFAQCKFIDCTFNRCNLSLVKFPSSRVFEVNFVECKLVGVDWTKASWPSFNITSQIKFVKCILNDSSFFGLTLNELKLNECKLHEVDFRECDLMNSSMINCDFENSLFMRTNLQNVDFTDSCNFNINLLENNLSQAKFSRFEALSLLHSLGIELVD